MSKSKSSILKTSLFNHKLCWLGAVLVVALSSPGKAAEIGWRRDLAASYREAATRDRPLLVVVGASWCGYCRQLHDQTLRNAALASRINEQFLPVLIDADEQPVVTQQLQVEMLPAVLVISPERRILNRSTGFQTVAQLDARLAQFKSAKPTPQVKAAVSRPTRKVGSP